MATRLSNDEIREIKSYLKNKQIDEFAPSDADSNLELVHTHLQKDVCGNKYTLEYSVVLTWTGQKIYHGYFEEAEADYKLISKEVIIEMIYKGDDDCVFIGKADKLILKTIEKELAKSIYIHYE